MLKQAMVIFCLEVKHREKEMGTKIIFAFNFVGHFVSKFAITVSHNEVLSWNNNMKYCTS